VPFLEAEVIRHCPRCDGESNYFIKFMSPNNQPEYVCWECVKREDKRKHRFSPAWKRRRRSLTKVVVGTS
jgi:hypothetical protein